MLKEGLAAEMLIIGVLDPARNHSLIRQIIGVLQIEKPCNQARR
jgi:hypothetical protein